MFLEVCSYKRSGLTWRKQTRKSISAQQSISDSDYTENLGAGESKFRSSARVQSGRWGEVTHVGGVNKIPERSEFYLFIIIIDA